MSLSNRYRQLAELIDTLEAHGISVQRAEPFDDERNEANSDGGFAVQLRVELPTDDAGTSFAAGSLGADRMPGRTSAEPPTRPVGVKPAASGAETGSENGEAVVDADETTRGTNGHVDAGGDGGDSNEQVTADAGTGSEGTTADAGSEREDAHDGTDDTTGDGVDAGANTEGDDAGADDAIPCTHPDCDRTFDTARGMKIHRTKAHPLSELVDTEGGRAAHRDPAVLARVYDEYETFAEMTAALGVDVGAQAVRKQMIRHGIHEPGSERPAGDTDAESEGGDTDVENEGGDEASPARERERDAPLDPDDTPVAERLPTLDLPGSLTSEDLRAAVEEANTLYDVQRALDLDQQTTRSVLAEYDLLELVSGRAASHRDREALKAEIGQRIRRAAT